jgi:hypothetical protein
MSYRGPELSGRIAGHSPGPEQDRLARLAVVSTMASHGESAQEIYQVLDILALLPGQETERDGLAGTLAAGSGEPKCGPKTVRTYI